MRAVLRTLMLLCLALGPGSLRMLHECAAHRHEAVAMHGDCEAGHHEAHDAPAPPRHMPADSDHCVACGDLATLSVDMPTPADVPVPAPRARITPRTPAVLARGVDAPRIVRGQPPPQA